MLINNFLNTEINPLKNKLLVDSNIYLIYPGSPSHSEIKEFRVYNHNLYLIKLDILELLKIFNNGYKEAEEYCEENEELVAEFRKIVKKLGGKTVAKALLDKLSQKPEIKDEIGNIEDIVDNSNY